MGEVLLALRVALANSLRRVVTRRVHQGLDLGEGRERGGSLQSWMRERREQGRTKGPVV